MYYTKSDNRYMYKPLEHVRNTVHMDNNNTVHMGSTTSPTINLVVGSISPPHNTFESNAAGAHHAAARGRVAPQRPRQVAEDRQYSIA